MTYEYLVSIYNRKTETFYYGIISNEPLNYEHQDLSIENRKLPTESIFSFMKEHALNVNFYLDNLDKGLISQIINAALSNRYKPFNTNVYTIDVKVNETETDYYTVKSDTPIIFNNTELIKAKSLLSPNNFMSNEEFKTLLTVITKYENCTITKI